MTTMHAGDAIIRATRLSKWYGHVSGLNDVTVEVPPGITALLGPKRRRQVDVHEARHRAAAAEPGRGRRARGAGVGESGCLRADGVLPGAGCLLRADDRPRLGDGARAPARVRPGGGRPCGAGGARHRRSRGGGRPGDRRVQQGHAAAGEARAGDRARPRAARAGRTAHRDGSAGAASDDPAHSHVGAGRAQRARLEPRAPRGGGAHLHHAAHRSWTNRGRGERPPDPRPDRRTPAHRAGGGRRSARAGPAPARRRRRGYLGFVVPVLGVFYGTSLIADEVEDRTITYLFTRPIRRGAVLVSLPSGLTAGRGPNLGWGAGFVDVDNDGLLDLFVANGHIYRDVHATGTSTDRQRNQVFRNTGRGRFQRVTETGGGLLVEESIRGAAFGDVDNDGDVDVLLVNRDATPTLLRNDTAGGTWITVRLVGTTSNRDAIGARVTAEAGGRRQTMEVRSGGSFISHNDVRVRFGLAGAARVDRLVIRWPNGLVEDVTALPANRVYVAREGAGVRPGP